jgi:hypothetical protein
LALSLKYPNIDIITTYLADTTVKTTTPQLFGPLLQNELYIPTDRPSFIAFRFDSTLVGQSGFDILFSLSALRRIDRRVILEEIGGGVDGIGRSNFAI